MKRFDLQKLFNNSNYYQSTIFVGKNGGGKSSLLNQLAEYFISKDQNIITISNCLNDKFSFKSKKIRSISAKIGEGIHKNCLYNAILNINGQVIFSLSKVLDYCNYQSKVGIVINNLDFYREINKQKKNIYNYLIDISVNNEIWINLNYNILYDPFVNKVINLLKSLGEIPDDNISFKLMLKSGEIIPLESISSGEASQITTLSFISTNVKDYDVILIDEPENSLHPEWQREYIDNILNVLNYLHVKIYIATHSPMIINNESEIFLVSDFEIEGPLENSMNIEKRIWDVFGIITPENEFFSNYLAHLLSKFESRRIDYGQAIKSLNDIYNACSDERQKQVIKDLKAIISGKGRVL